MQPRRRAIEVKMRALALATLLAIASIAGAQIYPAKPVRLVVPFAPGGGTDTIARTIAMKLSENLGKAVVVDNRSGAGGVIGADTVAKAAPDGYTLLMGTPGSLTINTVLLPKIPYDTLRDFAPVTLATLSPFVLIVHPSLPVSSVQELIALAKQKPNALNYGSAGTGSVAHLSAEQFKGLAHVQLTHVPYKGAGPAMVEAGVAGYEASTASGLLAPAKTPRAIVERLHGEMVKSRCDLFVRPAL